MPYSYETSLPPYKENIAFNKKRQCDEVFDIIEKGGNNLLKISQVSGIPQAIVSARVNDLITDSRVKYEGHTVYNDRLRKKIVTAVKIIVKAEQINLF